MSSRRGSSTAMAAFTFPIGALSCGRVQAEKLHNTPRYDPLRSANVRGAHNGDAIMAAKTPRPKKAAKPARAKAQAKRKTPARKAK